MCESNIFSVLFTFSWFSFVIICISMQIFCWKSTKHALFSANGRWNTELFHSWYLKWAIFCDCITVRLVHKKIGKIVHKKIVPFFYDWLLKLGSCPCLTASPKIDKALVGFVSCCRNREFPHSWFLKWTIYMYDSLMLLMNLAVFLISHWQH